MNWRILSLRIWFSPLANIGVSYNFRIIYVVLSCAIRSIHLLPSGSSLIRLPSRPAHPIGTFADSRSRSSILRLLKLKVIIKPTYFRRRIYEAHISIQDSRFLSIIFPKNKDIIFWKGPFWISACLQARCRLWHWTW